MSLEEMRLLFDHMLECRHYKAAFQVALCHAGLSQESTDTSLLQTLIDSPLDDDVLRAGILLQYADSLQSQDKAEEANEYLAASEILYSASGHAFGPSLIHLRRLRQSKAENRQCRIDAAFRIKSQLEAIENWNGVRVALQVLTEISSQAPDDALSTSLNVEYLQLRTTCRNELDWVTQRVTIARKWNFHEANRGRSLEALEQLYQEIKHMDAPILVADVVMLLYDNYTQIGDAGRAQLWLAQQRQLLPRNILILHDLDQFFLKLKATMSASEPELECLELQKELDVAKLIILKTSNLMDRYNEVTRVTSIATMYVKQYKIRGLEQTGKLANMCAKFVEDCCSLLSEEGSKDQRAIVLQTKARLKLVEACEPPMTLESIPKRIDLHFAASVLQQEALDLYTEIEKWPSVSMAKQQKALSLQTAWLLQGFPSDSAIFHEAADLLAAAAELSRKIHHTVSVRSATIALVKHWFKGFQNNINMPSTNGEGEVTPPIMMVFKYLDEVDALTNVERNDLSALENERSILAKQNLRMRLEFAELYDIGIKVCACIPGNIALWTWVQTAKSRGVSDLLALGVILPAILTNAINADPELVQLVEEEKKKQSDLEAAPVDSKFYLTKELEMQRKKMREHPPLANMLNLREGEPVEVDALRNLQTLRAATHAADSKERDVVFIDWFVYGNIFGVLIVTKSAILALPTSVTLEMARNWKDKYLIHDPNLGHVLDDSDLTPLQELSSLIKPVIENTEGGDLLVFCPTGALHGIPLHAATLDDTSRKSIIERNPIVYTSSMTTLHHCVSRELQHDRTDADSGTLNHSFVAVFEETDDIDVDTATWGSTRDSLYQSAQDIGSNFSGSGVTVGQKVSPQLLRQSFESDMMYFFGHCNDSYDNILQQALILAPVAEEQQLATDLGNLAISDGTAGDSSPGKSTPNSSVETSQTSITGSAATPSPPPVPIADAEPFPRLAPHHFTVGDIFRSKVQASNIMLIACGSASESNTPGDEPLGIVTALLCAGTSSVIGTLWKVEAGRGMEFSRRFYDMLFNEAEAARTRNANEPKSSPEGEATKAPLMLLDMAVILQKVVCKMKRNSDFRVPFQWAPYMLSGSWFVQRG